MKSNLALFVLLAFIASTVTASPPAKYDLSVNDILQSVTNGVKAATEKVNTFTTDNAQAIQEFVQNTVKVISDLLNKAAEEISKLDGQALEDAINDFINNQLVNAIKNNQEAISENLHDLIQKILDAIITRDLPIDPQVLTDALNAHCLLLDQAVVDNTGRLYGVYNGWANQGIASNLLTTLLTSRRTLLDGLYTPVLLLCQIKGDTSGKFAASSKDSVTASLANIKTTAQSAKAGCTNLLTCSLLNLRAQQIIQACNC